jgi:class 3 adenylate cyclase/ActR/RegA family two-component response regulator
MGKDATLPRWPGRREIVANQPPEGAIVEQAVAVTDPGITVFLADDNLLVREGVRALLAIEPDLEVVGTAADYDELIDGAEAAAPQVIVTDIRMPPAFQREGIDAAKQVRKRHPGTGVVVLSQYDDPEYAISLLREGSQGYAYLLKDRVDQGEQLARAVRAVAVGGSMLDPAIAEALVTPVSRDGDLTEDEERLLQLVAEGRPIKAIAASRRTTPAAASAAIEGLFLKLARQATARTDGALRRLRLLHQAIVEREERQETLSRLLPAAVVEKLRGEGRRIGDSERLVVTVLLSDIRGFSTIAEDADPTRLAAQLSEHRAEMGKPIMAADGTVMAFIGDAVMAVFGAPFPQPDHAARALETARAMQATQDELNRRWAAAGLPPFHIGIGLSTGEVAAALLGSEERLEYTVVGDTVNLAQRLQQWAGPGQIVLSEPTWAALGTAVDAERLPPAPVKGRSAAVGAYRITTGPAGG